MVNPFFLAIYMHEGGHMRVVGRSENICCFQVEMLSEEVEGLDEIANEPANKSLCIRACLDSTDCWMRTSRSVPI